MFLHVWSVRRLDEQGVKNHSKVMVLKVSDAELKQQMSEEEQKKKEQNTSLQRTQKGFQILSQRGVYTDTMVTSLHSALLENEFQTNYDQI